jgi:hypothetical protein
LELIRTDFSLICKIKNKKKLRFNLHLKKSCKNEKSKTLLYFEC